MLIEPIDPNPGPTLPMLVATRLKLVIRSSPVADTIIVPAHIIMIYITMKNIAKLMTELS